MEKPVLSIQGYDRRVCCAFEKTLCTLGEDSKNAIYQYLDDAFQISTWEVSAKIDIVEKTLDDIFGYSAVCLKRLFHIHLAQAIGNVCIVVPLSQFFSTLAEYNQQNKINHQNNKIDMP
jgi:hypothetical protein